MRRLREFLRRFGGLFNKRRKDRELDEEIESHLQMHIEDNLRLGMTPEEARRQALIRLGGIESTKEAYRDQRGLPLLEILCEDLRYGARQLRKHPGFSAVALLTLALGIGANTAIFSVVNSVLLKPLAYDNPGQLVGVWEAPQPGQRNSVSPGAFLDWKEQAEVFDSLSLVDETAKNLTGKGDPERLKGMAMSASGLEMLRLRPLLGRTFMPQEDQPGNNKVVVLAHGFWMRRFGGNPNVMDQTIQLNDETYTIIGVLGRRALLWEEAEFVIPFTLPPSDRNQRSANWLKVMGRLKNGITIEQAQAAMDTLALRLKPLYPAHKQTWGVTLVPMRDQLTGNIKPTLLVLLGAVSFVLLIACGNVASLLLARASGRQKEMAIRAALGATRGRVIRQLLTENVLLSAWGGMLGVLLAYWGVRVISQLTAIQLPRVHEISVDVRALGFALFVSVASGLVMGLFPAVQASRLDLNDTFKEGARGSAGGAPGRVRGALIAAEVALSLMLLIGAGLLLNSFVRLSFVPPGINAEHGLAMRIDLPSQKYPDAERRAVFFEQVMERINGLPGVEYSGVTQTLPLAGYCPETMFTILGRAPQDGTRYTVGMDFSTAGYFQAVGIPLLKGRTFDQRDKADAPGVVVVNETLAREYFPNEDPIGKRLHLLEPNTGRMDAEWEIVGIVGNVHQHGLTEPVKPCVYRPLSRSFIWHGGNLIVRSANDPAALVKSVRQAVLDVDPSQPVANVQTLKEIVAMSVAQRRFLLCVVGGFAAAALLLAVIGLYGVMGYAVSQRTREIGVRMALGAQRRDVIGMVVGQGMRLVAVGVGLGLVGAFALSRMLQSFLYEIKPSDPLTFALIPLVLSAVALVACWIPARRASKVDPMIALRYE